MCTYPGGPVTFLLEQLSKHPMLVLLLHNKRICKYVFNDSKSAGLRPDRND